MADEEIPQELPDIDPDFAKTRHHLLVFHEFGYRLHVEQGRHLADGTNHGLVGPV